MTGWGPDAREIIEDAERRAELREAAYVPTDYDALNKMVKRQKGALTRAINSGDPDKVIVACRKAVREWNEPGAMWPDNWSHWQRALDDVLPWNQRIELEDLA